MNSEDIILYLKNQELKFCNIEKETYNTKANEEEDG